MIRTKKHDVASVNKVFRLQWLLQLQKCTSIDRLIDIYDILVIILVLDILPLVNFNK